MQRVKLFEAAHKGLRNALSQFSYLLGKCDFNNVNDVNKIHSLGKDLCMMLSSHANDENSIILAALEEKIPGSSKHDMDDHERLEQDQDAIEKLLNDIKELNTRGADASSSGAELYIKFSKFHGEYLLHTVEEETETQRLLWENFTDQELHAMRGKIIGRFTPEAFEKWQSFIMPAITQSDLLAMLGGMKANAPEQFTRLMVMAEKFLPAEEFAAINEKLK
ncbi:MAG: hemerythrin domain-containing protein [Ignavibacteriales bacterium]|nr:hemerythrin domain-containing protein [Ignavibacteriales bacterium]